MCSKDWKFDNKIVAHLSSLWAAGTDRKAIENILLFRQTRQVCLCIWAKRDHNTDQWQADFLQTMRDNNLWLYVLAI